MSNITTKQQRLHELEVTISDLRRWNMPTEIKVKSQKYNQIAGLTDTQAIVYLNPEVKTLTPNYYSTFY